MQGTCLSDGALPLQPVPRRVWCGRACFPSFLAARRTALGDNRVVVSERDRDDLCKARGATCSKEGPDPTPAVAAKGSPRRRGFEQKATARSSLGGKAHGSSKGEVEGTRGDYSPSAVHAPHQGVFARRSRRRTQRRRLPHLVSVVLHVLVMGLNFVYADGKHIPPDCLRRPPSEVQVSAFSRLRGLVRACARLGGTTLQPGRKGLQLAARHAEVVSFLRHQDSLIWAVMAAVLKPLLGRSSPRFLAGLLALILTGTLMPHVLRFRVPANRICLST